MKMRSFGFLVWAFLFPFAISGCTKVEALGGMATNGDVSASAEASGGAASADSTSISEGGTGFGGEGGSARTGDVTAIAEGGHGGEGGTGFGGEGGSSSSSSNSNTTTSSATPSGGGTITQPVVRPVCATLGPKAFERCDEQQPPTEEEITQAFPDLFLGLYVATAYEALYYDDERRIIGWSDSVTLRVADGFVGQFEAVSGYDTDRDGAPDAFYVSVDGESYSCEDNNDCTRFDGAVLDYSIAAQARQDAHQAFTSSKSGEFTLTHYSDGRVRRASNQRKG